MEPEGDEEWLGSFAPKPLPAWFQLDLIELVQLLVFMHISPQPTFLITSNPQQVKMTFLGGLTLALSIIALH